MGSGGYVICELGAIEEQYPDFQRVIRDLDERIIAKCDADWAPKKFSQGLAVNANEYGRTTILPALFDDNTGTQMTHWRQSFTSTGHQTLIAGTRAGNTIPEDFKVAWMGLSFPNKNQHITEIKFQIGDRKYGRISLEEIKGYDVPAVIFEEGYIIDEEQSFDLYGYVEGPLPASTGNVIYQRIVMLGAAYFKVVDKVLGNPGAAI